TEELPAGRRSDAVDEEARATSVAGHVRDPAGEAVDHQLEPHVGVGPQTNGLDAEAERSPRLLDLLREGRPRVVRGHRARSERRLERQRVLLEALAGRRVR